VLDTSGVDTDTKEEQNRDDEPRRGKDKKKAHTIGFALNTKSWPYGGERPRYPDPSRAERLASVLRATRRGQPIQPMRKWKEVRDLSYLGLANPVGTDQRRDKAVDMAEQKALAAHRAAIEKSVEKLAGRRSVLQAELDVVEAELKLLLSMLKAAGGPSPHVADGPEPPTKNGAGRAKKGKKARDRDEEQSPAAVCASMLAEGEVTPELLAEQTGQTLKNASQMLARLFRNGEASRPRRGIYGAA
jgi:hypothetical protein